MSLRRKSDGRRVEVIDKPFGSALVTAQCPYDNSVSQYRWTDLEDDKGAGIAQIKIRRVRTPNR